MTYQNRLSPAIAVIFSALIVSVAPPALAGDTPKAWIKDDISVDGTAQIYLSAAFTSIKGKFPAMPESITDARDTIEGEFLVGEYRYLFKKPEAGRDGKVSDELVSTEIMNCKENFFGTVKQVRKYEGKVVSNEVTPAGSVLMIQINSPTIGSKLCALYKKKAGSGPDRARARDPS